MLLDTSPQSKIIRAFSKNAHRYNEFAVVQDQIARQLCEPLPKHMLEYPDTILDVGCGTGFLTKRLLGMFASSSVVGLDASQEMLDQISLDARLSTTRGDFNNIPYKDGHYSLLASSTALQWSDNISATLAEWLRVIKRDGYLAVATLVDGTLSEWRNSWLKAGEHSSVNNLPTASRIRQVPAEHGLEWDFFHQEQTIIYHETVLDALNSVRAIGANRSVNNNRLGGLMGRNTWQDFLAAYDDLRVAEGLPLTYEVCYGILRKI